MGVNGKGTSDVPQVHELVVAIETNQKELEDAINDLTKEVKDKWQSILGEGIDIGHWE